MTNNTADQPIVVGVDGSEGSQAALEWAVEEAKLRGVTLALVMAWEFPIAAYYIHAATPPPEELEAAAREVLDEVAAKVAADDLSLSTSLVEGGPAPVLLAAAADAQMLVVGSRGRGGFAGLLLGSVSQHCVTHAPCPVVVVPAAG